MHLDGAFGKESLDHTDTTTAWRWTEVGLAIHTQSQSVGS